jgi:phosphatidylserine/phosphatidylglycerophosphate/cardiolipin synthase-like enzyme
MKGDGCPDTPQDLTAAAAARLAAVLPVADMQDLAEAAVDGVVGLRRLRGRVAAQVVRAACDELIPILDRGASAPLVAGALLGAAHAIQQERVRQRIDVVWTGPSSTVTSSRLTSAVVIELIDSAHDEIALVSFATYGQHIRPALDQAAARGVHVVLLLESPSDNARYTGTSYPFPGLRAQRLSWPSDRRPARAAIHAKIIVIDRKTALVGSANLTGHAMDHNLECGVLIQGGTEPARIRAHLTALVDEGTLVAVQ